MSKNFVREIDGIKNINKQEYYTNKPNDLLSTREHNYIRKEKQEYHCLTDNVKQTKASNVRYTDTTANPNVNYNLLSVDNSQVPKNNTNTISASSLVEALEAKDKQIKELKDKIDNISAEKAEKFEGVINTSSSINKDVTDGYMTAKTIKKLPDNEILVEFIFTGKLTFNDANNRYIAYFNRQSLLDCCINFAPDLFDFLKYIEFNPEIYVNGIKFALLAPSGELQFEYNGMDNPDTLSTATTFTIKMKYDIFGQ